MSEAATAPEGSTEASTLAETLVASIENANSPSDVEKLTSMVENLKQTIGRQGNELGELRRMKEIVAEAPVDTTSLSDELYSNPEGLIKRLEAAITQKVLAGIAPTMEPVRHAQVTRDIQQGNSLATKLLNDPETIEFLQTQVNDENVRQTYEDMNRVRLEAALFRRAGGVYGRQMADKANPPLPPRPESAGAASPEAAPGRPGPAKKEATTLDEAFEQFKSGMAALSRK